MKNKSNISSHTKLFFSRLLCLFFAAFVSPLSSLAQEQWTSADFKKCNTAKDIAYLTKNEKEVIFYLNLVRSNPKLFEQTYLKNYLDTAAIERTPNVESLIAELKTMVPVKILSPQFDLFEVAKNHATEMGIYGKTGHINIKGESFEVRGAKLSQKYKSVMENCQYGYNKGLSIVIDLLIDEEIPDFSHRKSLLSNNIKYVGAVIRKHKVYNYNCVIELSGSIKSNPK